MRTFIVSLLASIALASVAGCGGSPPVSDTAEVIPAKSPSESSKTEAPTPPPAGETPK